jgi:hypothetical protein
MLTCTSSRSLELLITHGSLHILVKHTATPSDYFLPQQLPGPAHPAAEGGLPQQAVSPRPGSLFLATPDIDDGVDGNFLRFWLPQLPQDGFSLPATPVRTSVVLPQSMHSYSYKGISNLHPSLNTESTVVFEAASRHEPLLAHHHI